VQKGDFQVKKIIDRVIPLIALALLLYFSYSSYTTAKALERVNRNYYEAQTDIGELLKRRFDSLLTTLSFGAIKNKKSKAKNIEMLKAQSLILKEKNRNATILLATIALGIILTYFILSLEFYALLMGIASLITLIFGIFTPILMIVIHKNVEYLGDIILSFESKTIFSTITHLYHNGNYPVAIAILLFSIIVPLLKTLSMIVVVIWRHFHIATKLIKFLKHLGKWSMLDVFVVALLLVYLSAGSSENSYSQIESGLYIFLIYVIFSIITSISVERLLSVSVKTQL